MRVVVTGGAGFVGSHVVERLVGRGDDVLVLDDLSRGRRDQLPAAAELVVVNVADEAAAAALRAFRPQAVVHLAAQMDVGASVRGPERDAEVNVVGTVRLLRAAADAGAACFVLASSGGAIYGDAAELPTPEEAPAQPRSPYGASKACGELYLELWQRTCGLRTVSLRLSNVYGPRQRGDGESGVVAIFAERLRRGEAPKIFGDGSQARDFVYVGDVVDATLGALTVPAARGAINVGTGIATSLTQLVAALRARLGGPAPTFAPGKPGEVHVSRLCVARAADVLSWRPKVSLEAGLATTLGARGSRPRGHPPAPRFVEPTWREASLPGP